MGVDADRREAGTDADQRQTRGSVSDNLGTFCRVVRGWTWGQTGPRLQCEQQISETWFTHFSNDCNTFSWGAGQATKRRDVVAPEATVGTVDGWRFAIEDLMRAYLWLQPDMVALG